ncbi:MAG: tRNA (adenosine(37)-N6)-dimethylallyltransferase MiaA [Pseudomonadota bacterium]
MTDAAAPTVLIAGPTATGKSGLALALAERLASAGRGAVIVNADAMQVYRDLRILTARPSPEDERRAPHALYGTIDGAERFSAGRWAREAAALVGKARADSVVPIVVGGTGLYFRALTDGLSDVPGVPEETLADAAARRAALGPDGFREEILGFDPEMARFPATDAQRMQRAWAVHAATGSSLSDWRARQPEAAVDEPFVRLVLEPPRETVYARCDARFDAMLAAGALDEVEALLARDLDPGLPVMKALGVPELADVLGGTASVEDASALAKTRTRRFVKRQLTWFRNQTPDWLRATGGKDALDTLAARLGAEASESPGAINVP